MQMVQDRTALVPRFGGQRVSQLVPHDNASYFWDEEQEARMKAGVPLAMPAYDGLSGFFGLGDRKVNAFKEFKKVHDQIGSVMHDTDRLLAAIIQANVRTGEPFNLPRMSNGRQEFTTRLLDQMRYGAELAVLSPDRVYQEMTSKVVSSREAIASYVMNQLEVLHTAEIVGKIFWLQKDVCRFTWHQFRVVKESGGVRHEVHPDRIRHEMDFTAKVIHELHQHDVIAAKELPLAMMRGMPERVQEMVKRLQDIAWIAPHIKIVDGTEIVHETVSDVVGERKWTEVREEMIPVPVPPPVRQQQFRPDPAIILGSYVLTGWETGGK